MVEGEGRGGNYVPPEPAGPPPVQEHQFQVSQVVASTRQLHRAVDTLTAEVTRTSVAIATDKRSAAARLKSLAKRSDSDPNAIRDEFTSIVADAGLTERERQAFESLVYDASQGAGTAASMGIGESRLSQLRSAAGKKLGLPKGLIRQLISQGVEQAQRDQGEAGEYVESLSEPDVAGQESAFGRQEKREKKRVGPVDRMIEQMERGVYGPYAAEQHFAEGGWTRADIVKKQDILGGPNYATYEFPGGMMSVGYDEYTKEITIHGIGGSSKGHKLGYGALSNQLGIAKLKMLKGVLSEDFPDAKYIGGLRVGGLKAYEPENVRYHFAEGGEVDDKTDPSPVTPYQHATEPDAEKQHWQKWERLPDSIRDFIMHGASGGRVDMTGGGVMPDTGKAPRGSDWHPAWLTDQEFVVNAESARKNRGLLESINHKAEGGHFAPGGIAAIPPQNVTPPGGSAQQSYTGRSPIYPGVSSFRLISNAAGIVFGPLGQTIAGVLYLVGQAQKMFQEEVVGATRAVGDFANALADPDANPSKVFTRAGDALSSGGERMSKGLNFAISPITAALGVDLIPQLKLFTGVTGEAAKQFGALMDAVDATAKRYGEFSPDIAVAQAMVEVQHTMGELRRAQESGPELARYLRAQVDLQQSYEDLKIRLLLKIMPIITTIVTFTENFVSGVDIISSIVEALNPLYGLLEALRRVANAQEDANRPEVQDPTSVLFQDAPGGVEVPQL